METKFTSDGRKVAVLGQLNSKESIVQEIFIINSQEIPSGENFIAKDLHDAPAISWKEKNLKELENRYNTQSKEWDRKIQDSRKHYQKVCEALDEKYSFAAQALKIISPDTFKLISNFLAGKIEFIVTQSYSGYEITPLDDALKSSNGYNGWDHIKLITLFGKDGGGMDIRLNRYSDGSGGSETIKPFTTYNDALQYVADWVNTDELTSYKIEAANKYSISMDAVKLSVYKQKEIDAKRESLNKKAAELEKIQIELTKLEGE